MDKQEFDSTDMQADAYQDDVICGYIHPSLVVASCQHLVPDHDHEDDQRRIEERYARLTARTAPEIVHTIPSSTHQFFSQRQLRAQAREIDTTTPDGYMAFMEFEADFAEIQADDEYCPCGGELRIRGLRLTCLSCGRKEH